MDKEIANVAIEFMKRVELRGQEVPAFLAVMDALHSVRDKAIHEEMGQAISVKTGES